MNVKRTIFILSLGALAIAAAIGIVVYRTASANAPALTGPARVWMHFGGGRGGDASNEDLADALGITVDELTAAYESATDAALDQAVADGLITQAQADELRERGAAFPFGGRAGEWLSRNGIDFDALLADALGITVEELQAAYLEAFNARIDAAVASGDLTQEQADLMKGRNALFSSESFRTSMQSAFEDAVQQAVTDGLITQAQADAILESESGFGFPGLRGFGGFGGHHEFGFGRHGGPGGWLPGSEPSSEPTEVPSDGGL